MSDPSRKKFKNAQDWTNYLNINHPISGPDLRQLRITCYKEIEALRERPLLIYATKFIENSVGNNSIDLSDVQGFTD